MLKHITGNITDVEKGIIAHGCNTLGVMGAGVAKQLAAKYPQMYREYQEFCTSFAGENIIGKVHWYRVHSDLLIANCFTQRSLGFNEDGTPPAILEGVVESIDSAMTCAKNLGIHEVYVPQIGSGLGGLNWDKDVYPELKILAYEHGADVDLTVVFYDQVKYNTNH